jgi:predicted alpha/beta hydrolase family esterase
MTTRRMLFCHSLGGRCAVRWWQRLAQGVGGAVRPGAVEGEAAEMERFV